MLSRQASPRSLTNGFDLTAVPGSGMSLTSYPPPMYQMGPQQPYEGMDISESPNNNLMQLDAEYEEYPSSIRPEDVAPYSPYISDDSRSVTPSGASPLPLHDDGAIDKDLPYAQLIWLALMEAPNHTMILRDIYDWFQRNTDKAADKETKGWQNSIRHNLSMNGAFQKVDQHCEESKRGYMWRLTQEAIEKGVKSTTRYRSKQPNKRGHRTGNYPQRQRAGAMGGMKAKKASLQRKARMNEGYRSEPYQSRSIPTPSSFDAIYTPELPMQTTQYPPSPYYSPSGSEVDHLDYAIDSYNSSPLQVPQTFHGLPISQQEMVAAYGDGYIHLPIDPAEPLFTNSPSPSTSEPRTPDSGDSSWSDMPLGPMGGVSHLPYENYVSSYAHEPCAENE
ncbi:hypothetical protein N0V90_005151 [Kalmusia sp. IMI 367209]|nr:hypothetical protein N0V90_005151 [Kalmusia sp. IMI 367209]